MKFTYVIFSIFYSNPPSTKVAPAIFDVSIIVMCIVYNTVYLYFTKFFFTYYLITVTFYVISAYGFIIFMYYVI